MRLEVKHDCPIEFEVYKQFLASASRKMANDMAACSGWFMVRVGVKQESTMRERMGRMGLHAWVPETTETIIRLSRQRRKGKAPRRYTEELKFPVFAGHVLCRFVPSPEAWHAIMNISGVQSIYVRAGSFEADSFDRRLESSLSERVIARLKELETEDHGQAWTPKFNTGDAVTVTDGPFAGQHGIVMPRNVGYGLVCIEIGAFGGPVPALMEESQLEVA